MPEEFAAALLLTAVFLMVARAGNPPVGKPEGWVYAGYGAYISTLWFMLVRLNASALSPRFLINSALKVSIAVFIGYVASRSDFFKAGGDSVVTLYFAIGLFHSWAMRALKKTAMATFGITSAWPTDVSLAFIDGLDDDAADVQEVSRRTERERPLTGWFHRDYGTVGIIPGNPEEILAHVGPDRSGTALCSVGGSGLRTGANRKGTSKQ